MQFTYVFYFFEFFFFIFLQENLLNKIVLKQNKSNLAIRLCLPDDVMTTVMTSVISPDSSEKSQDIGNMTLTGHEAE